MKKLIFNSKIYKYTCKDIWDFKQKISGLVNLLITNENNYSETHNIPIKDIMQSLKNNNFLPKEITINNNDNSISFKGKMKTEYNCGFEQSIKENFINITRKKRNIESSKNKWIDEFKNSINNDQHLPIDNKTNFVTSNITSL